MPAATQTPEQARLQQSEYELQATPFWTQAPPSTSRFALLMPLAAHPANGAPSRPRAARERMPASFIASGYLDWKRRDLPVRQEAIDLLPCALV
jgi:hypothetical protein